MVAPTSRIDSIVQYQMPYLPNVGQGGGRIRNTITKKLSTKTENGGKTEQVFFLSESIWFSYQTS